MKKLLIALFAVALIVSGCGKKQPLVESKLYKDVFLKLSELVNMMGRDQCEKYLEDEGFKYEVEEDGLFCTIKVDVGDPYQVEASFWPYSEDPENEELVTLASVSYGNELYGVEVGVDPDVGIVLGSEEYQYYTWDGINKGNGGVVKDMDAVTDFVNGTMEENR